MWGNRYVCGGATEEGYWHVWVFSPPIWKDDWCGGRAIIVRFDQDGFQKTWAKTKSYSPFAIKRTHRMWDWGLLMLLLWDLLTRQNCRFSVGDTATKVKSLFDLENDILTFAKWHWHSDITKWHWDSDICKMTLRSKPDKYSHILESIQCSGNYWWRRSIPTSEDVQLICASLLCRTWKSWSPSTDQRWLITTL